jgi:hypothetical protein
MRYQDENIWLTQKMLAVLYDVDVRTINYHLKKIFEDCEVEATTATIRNFRIVQTEGNRQVEREVKHYGLQELESLGRIVNAYLDLAEDMAKRNIPMTMEDWAKRLDMFLRAADRDILKDAGKISARIAREYAETEFEKFRIIQDRLFESDFDRHLLELEKTAKTAKGRKKESPSG